MSAKAENRQKISIRRHGIRKTREDIVIDTVVTVVMILVVIVTVYPFYYIIINAFNNGVDSSLGGMYFYPRRPTLENFENLLKDGQWNLAIIISVSKTVSGTILGLLTTSFVAYALSFENLKGRKIYNKLYIFTMYFSGGMIPFYILLKNIGLLNTFWVYIIPGMLNVYYMLIIVNFFSSLPRTLYESAWLDGAGHIRVFFVVTLPLSKACLATIALFFAVQQWNSWIDSVYYVTKESLRPMSYLMMEIIQKAAAASQISDAQTVSMAATAVKSTTTSLQMASMVLAVTPILIVYPFLQKYFVKGVMIGSIKG